MFYKGLIFLYLVCTAISQVKVLTDSDIEKTIAESPYILIDFYAPWCGHCKRLEPEFEKAEKLIGKHAVLGKIDATTEKNAKDLYKPQGFPTLFWFVKGILIEEYQGERTAEDLTIWVLSRIFSQLDL